MTLIYYRLILVINVIRDVSTVTLMLVLIGREMMDLKTINEVIKFSVDNNIRIIDLTGGAPEINKHFKYIVQTCKENNIHIIDRCNLTILESEGMRDLPKFLAKIKLR